MSRAILLGALTASMLAVIAAATAPSKSSNPPDRAADRKALTELVKRWTDRADRAWNARDARLMFAADTAAGADTAVVVRTPDGRPIDRAANIADLQRRMDMTTRIDTMRTVVDSVFFPGPNSAVVFSSQLFVRMMKVPGQPERQRISSVIHRQRFGRGPQGWAAAGPVEELNPKARWADEKPEEKK